MDFNWFFKGFRNYPREAFQNDDKDFEDHPPFKDEGKVDSNKIPVDPFDNFEDISRDVFQHMDAMLNRIFSGNLASVGSEEFFENVPNNSNPRSIMLKEPDCENCKPSIVVPLEENKRSLMIDSDIDEKVARHGLLLDEKPRNRVMHHFSYKKSIRSVRLPDGTMEEHHSVTDSDGNTTTTVRRSIGDQSYEVTTHSDSHGLKVKNTNLDESHVSDFETRWQNIKDGNKYLPALDMQPKAHNPKLNPPPGDPSYLSLFKKFFRIDAD